MTDVLMFFIAVIVSMLDPIQLIGCVLAGSLIRKEGVAMAVGVLWSLALRVLIVLPAARMHQSSVSVLSTVASLCGAIILTAVVCKIAAKVRANKQSKQAPETSQPPPDQEKQN